MGQKNKVMTVQTKIAGFCGLIVVVANIVAVALLTKSPHTYKPWVLQEWLAELRNMPERHAWSAWLFTIGVFALIPLAGALRRKFERTGSEAGVTGASLIVVGAYINGTATLLPFVVAMYLDPNALGVDTAAVSYGLLGTALVADACFNLIFGAGLLLSSIGLFKEQRILGFFGVVTGINVMIVAGQAVSTSLANWLGVAGPLWLIWVAWISFRMIRSSDYSS